MALPPQSLPVARWASGSSLCEEAGVCFSRPEAVARHVTWVPHNKKNKKKKKKKKNTNKKKKNTKKNKKKKTKKKNTKKNKKTN